MRKTRTATTLTLAALTSVLLGALAASQLLIPDLTSERRRKGTTAAASLAAASLDRRRTVEPPAAAELSPEQDAPEPRRSTVLDPQAAGLRKRTQPRPATPKATLVRAITELRQSPALGFADPEAQAIGASQDPGERQHFLALTRDRTP